MFGSTDIKVDIPPILICFLAYKGLVIVRIHVAEIICAAAGKAWHGAEFDRISVHLPSLCSSKRRFSCLCRKELVHLRKLERKILEGHRGCDSILEIHRERLSPISLTGEYGITEPVVYLSMADSMLLHIIDCCRDSLLHSHSVEET